MTLYALYRSLEPAVPTGDVARGVRAEVADPVWFLARQWQMGEQQGEDASSPVVIEAAIAHMPITYDPERPTLDPAVVPAEALLEAEPGDWWTLGRRARLGRAAAPLVAGLGLSDAALVALRFGGVPAPYEALAGQLDGLAVFRSGLLGGNALWAEVPSPPPDRWQPDTLVHRAVFAAETAQLEVPDHGGGALDWYSADGAPTAAAPALSTRRVLPSRLRYPGAPEPRWWQIEDHAVDIGGFAPDRAHVATPFFLDVAAGHRDDWFTFPVPPPFLPRESPPPSAGVVVRIGSARVKDTFDEWWEVRIPPAREDPPEAWSRPWSLFRTHGLPRTDLVVWPTATAPLASEPLDDILLGVDEDANLLWAVELTVDGTSLLGAADTPDAVRQTLRTGTRRFHYLPSTTLPPHWHPYRIEASGHAGGPQRMFVQGLVADLTGAFPRTRAGPRSSLLGGPSGTGPGRGHELRPDAVGSAGLRLVRRYRLGRGTDGRPVLWIERSRAPLLGGPVSHLRFDVLAEEKDA
ncbi:MAG: hypothetical protein U1F10_15540 [Burkholderiales bacterium]